MKIFNLRDFIRFYLSGMGPDSRSPAEAEVSVVSQQKPIGPLQLAVTWYKIRHAGEQATHWDIQNKENANLS